VPESIICLYVRKKNLTKYIILDESLDILIFKAMACGGA
jgi:hypothetical protein